MKTIEITTEAMPWANGAPQPLGVVVETDDDVADAIIANGHAKLVATKKSRAKDAQPEPQEPAGENV